MVDRMGAVHGCAHRLGVAQVANDNLRALGMPWDWSTRAANESAHPVTACQQRIDHMAADKARCACDDAVHETNSSAANIDTFRGLVTAGRSLAARCAYPGRYSGRVHKENPAFAEL